MKKTPVTLSMFMGALLFVPLNNAFSANQIITTEDGREVTLNDDGSWKFNSTDRFVNTKDGRRVRLKDNGSWEYMGNAPVVLKKQVRTVDVDIILQKVVIETYEKKVLKSKRVKTQTVFYLNFDLSPLAKTNISITKNDISHIEIKDNNGKSYPVLSVQPTPVTIKPGSKSTIVVRAEGSPLWLSNVKSMKMILKPGVLGLQESITLSQNTADFEEKDVSGFE